MNALGNLLTKHRNLFLVGLLLITLALSGVANRTRLQAEKQTVDIPVLAAGGEAIAPLEEFRRERTAAVQADIAALEQLIAHDALDQETREQAAEQLQRIIDIRQAQTALEGALSGSSLYPCVAVLEAESLTLVTAKKELTDEDSALILSLAAAHAGVAPENVRVISAE